MAYASTAEFIDKEILAPHNIPPHSTNLTGELFVMAWRTYDIPVLAFLVITGAETSLGDLKQGGLLAEKNNFGCLRNMGKDTKWGELSDGIVWIRGKDWYTFPNPDQGMKALGRYLKIGPSFRPRFYHELLNRFPIDWRSFANVYYGENVNGLEEYIANLKQLDNKFKTKAAQFGFVW